MPKSTRSAISVLRVVLRLLEDNSAIRKDIPAFFEFRRATLGLISAIEADCRKEEELIRLSLEAVWRDTERQARMTINKPN
jgi:hypothetical protein